MCQEAAIRAIETVRSDVTVEASKLLKWLALFLFLVSCANIAGILIIGELKLAPVVTLLLYVIVLRLSRLNCAMLGGTPQSVIFFASLVGLALILGAGLINTANCFWNLLPRHPHMVLGPSWDVCDVLSILASVLAEEAVAIALALASSRKVLAVSQILAAVVIGFGIPALTSDLYWTIYRGGIAVPGLMESMAVFVGFAGTIVVVVGCLSAARQLRRGVVNHRSPGSP
jgi:hypothetical protein